MSCLFLGCAHVVVPFASLIVVLSERNEEKDAVLSLVNVTEKALQLQNKDTHFLSRRDAKSGAEYFAARSFQGLEIHSSDSYPEPFLIGRTGKASGYEDEESK